MNKKHVIIICVLLVGIILCGLAPANSRGTEHRKGSGFKRHHKGGALQLLARYQHQNLMVQVLSEMTGQAQDVVRLKLKDQRMRTVMRELNIDRQALRSAMQAKEKAQIKKAVADGSITPQQEEKILARMETHAKRRELIRKLIEKGLEDGSITHEEALMLMPKWR